MPFDATLRQEIKRNLDGVAGLGQTFDHFVHVRTEEDIQDRMRDANGRLHYWCVCLVPSDAIKAMRLPASCEQAYYTYDIHGWYAFSNLDQSEKTFAGLVEAVVAAFRADPKLRDPANPTVDNCIDSGPLDWIEGGGPEGWKMMPPGEGGVLCHYARLRLPVLVHTQ